ncbi:MAG TPA: hypothetical protein VLL54_03285 [Pyrinomonadaceae bacterium]|nr:hypothetical protein [Pyrinomonadaceae bacterium]
MKRRLSFFAVALLLAVAVPTFGDIAKPKSSPTLLAEPRTVFHTRLAIVPDSKAWEARLQISQSDLEELRAALNNTPGNQSLTQQLTHSSTRTMLAGVFLFLSLSFAGVWLARSMHTRGQKIAAALLFGAAVFGATTMMTNANAGPPGSYYWKKLSQNLGKNQPTNGGVDIVIVPDGSDGSGMKLIIPTRGDY